MGTLINLDGITAKEIPAVFIEDVGHIRSIIENGDGATTAGYNGAISIWKDDEGNIRCKSYKYLRTTDYQIYSDMKQVEEWYKKWSKKIQ